MKELELTEDIIVKLGLDPKKGWEELTVDESADIYVDGVCDVGDETYKCSVAKTLVYNVDTGEMVFTECQELSDPNSKLCYWGGQGGLPISEE